MHTPNSCTPQEAVMAYRFSETGSPQPVLVLDLDAVTAAVCTIEKGCPAKTVWSYRGNEPQIPFFRAAARALAPGCDEQAAAEALYRSAPSWRRALQQYCKFRQEDFALEPVTVAGRTLELRCSQLTQLLEEAYAPSIRQMLEQASSYRKTMDQSDRVLLLPSGALSVFYPAEELIRKSFYSPFQVGLLSLPGLLTWDTDPVRAATEGKALHQQLVSNQTALNATWTMRILRRTADKPQSDTLILAHKGTHADQLRQVQYQEPVMAIPGEELTLFIGSSMYRAQIPKELFSGAKMLPVRVGLGMPGDQPLLYIRSGEREVTVRESELKKMDT